MKKAVFCSAVLFCVFAAARATSHDLTFEDRVNAQAAIERVYHAHQIGATQSFEAAVPRAVLESKVRKYLEQTVALEMYWKTSVTDAMLQGELERMAHGTKMPERLLELYAALGNDPFLIKECLARATLVDRLTHNFYAFDPTLHVEARRRAEELHRQLAAGELSPLTDHPNRSVAELVMSETAGQKPKSFRHQLSPNEFRTQRSRLPEVMGQVSALEERSDAFVVRVGLSETAGDVRVASYVVAKTTWDDWWEKARAVVQAAPVVAVASDRAALPLPAKALRVGGDSEGPQENGLPCPADDSWTPTNTTTRTGPPSGRDSHTVVWTGSVMVVWGGRSWDGSDNYPNTGGRYDPTTDSWTSMSTTGAPSGRYLHTAVWAGSEMVVWGGTDFDSVLATGGRYNPATDTWTSTSTTGAPAARFGHTAVWTGSEMVVWGGFDNTGGRYNPATDTWTSTSTVGAPAGREYHTAVWTDSVMIVWGGEHNGVSLNTGGRYNPATDSWTPTSTVGAPPGVFDHTAVWTGSVMVVWGGQLYSGEEVNTGGRYNPVTDVWTPTATSGAPFKRITHTAVWTGSVMVIWGGYFNDGVLQRLNTGGRYNPVTDIWTPTSTTGAPSERLFHTAVWTGSRMVVWGGSSGRYLDTGGRYDPTTDSWTPTFTTDAPSGRELPSTVWTGSLMVVWGGYFWDGTDQYLNTGGRYDPATDSWTPTSTTGAPTGREWSPAVWTGSRMVVWGGYLWDGSDHMLNTGGRYDPTTDSWTPTSMTGAPSARAGHTSVWTGSQMVVWGGDFYDGVDHFLNTGGRYNPATDSWTATSTTGAPSAREFHTAVWTGSRVVVWGGYFYDGVDQDLNTGGLYDPATNSWTSTSTTGAPSAREFHTAVWTGSRMVVWGGAFYDGSSGYVLDTGGQYNATTNSWTPTSMVGAPSARDGHTTVWTGSEMVVWGGEDYYTYLDTGGRYNPLTDSWTPTSTTGAPYARVFHAAVWTGSRMIVWGGDDFSLSGYANTGGLYSLGSSVDNDGDGYSGCQGDCDDSNPAIHPGASETCNGKDDDCDTVIDNGGGILCGDGNACTNDVCNGVAGCSHVNDTAACNDDNVCTTDTCNPVNGCVHANNAAACDDTNACTAGDTCGGGTCHAGAAVVCNDNNACTTDTCNVATGCVFTNNTAACDDGNPCTDDTCNPASGCVHNPTSCGDGNACTADACDPASGCSNIHKTVNMDATVGSFSEHRVDGRDLVVLANAYDSCSGDASNRYESAADLDPVSTPPHTGACVDEGDFHQFMNSFGHSCPQ